ncbi:hypothetical protein J2X20_000882 [Pelomonas saccharophila]|uniref:Uncharacterized protein n=1 Tax=Roseateles saccharophilus TaxID=304 RepID=A0ABU1YHF6_ROSSA|nr:hypothetical protein [Roseateles saccharophilus]MDR7268253.1 hypothetical protein [Roseateles saccharophilus]
MSHPAPPNAQPAAPAPANPPATHLPQHPQSDDAPSGQEKAIQPDDADREDPDLQHESPV